MPLSPVALDPQSRRDALAAMADTELDVLVIGAGVVGAGVALDAVTRGLTVGLVEARDYASGTSSRSSKLVHGGLRYLKQLDFGLVFEALRERSLILETLAPHLARPVEFLYPLTRAARDRVWVGAGVGVYDALGAGRGVPAHHRHLGKRKTEQRFPGGKSGTVRGGVRFYEGHLDDARHTLMLARTAAGYGALCANSARAVGFLEKNGRVVGARVVDVEGDNEIEVRARVTINATGAWTDEVQKALGKQGRFRVHASKGVHIVVPRAAIDSRVGIVTETPKSLLFVIPCPWSEQHWLIGTTDTSWDLDLAHPAATASDIDYILTQVNRLLESPISRDDIVGVYAGLRPLLAGHSDETAKLSREHAVVSPADGLVVIAGGKYTTYRVMAKDAVDEALRGRPSENSRTERLPLLGADGYHEMWAGRSRLSADSGLPVATIEHLLGRYGSAITEVLALIEADRGLARPITPHGPYLRAEVVYAVSHEGALHLEDILTRRTRMSIDTADRGVDAAQSVAELAAPLLNWDEVHTRREVAQYRARVEAEIESQRQPDDLSADAIRKGAPDPRSASPVASDGPQPLNSHAHR
ncbi:glycerol-3-phosphate dehydrogenase/oxidase [Mycobacterium sp. DL440]|uniref:glycerol-3-phosphate dehydrogenase/oxidase n=1 Tax=Mycobacterium sp. DL440 TaxID=2675523 RepID=UPI00141E3D6E|nr:glycerol-3-phosphate dehydrogenase/oxidase [Mycobacterium sp. DL440]